MLPDLSLGEILQRWALNEIVGWAVPNTEPVTNQLLDEALPTLRTDEALAVGWAVPNTEPVTNQLLDEALPTLRTDEALAVGWAVPNTEPVTNQLLDEALPTLRTFSEIVHNPHFNEIIPNFNLSEPNRATQTTLETLWRLWLPLAERLARQQQTLGRPFVQGILGGQGTGKTTLARMVQLILSQWEPKLRTVCISIDDLYKTYADRQRLQEEDPRLIWRGPPGTHDVDLGVAVLDALRRGESPVAIPRFDKSAWGGAGDRTTPEIVTGADIVLFEGWFVGVQPVPDAAFDNPPEPIITRDDIAFARDMNRKLQDYLPLWERLDSLMVLYPVDWRLSLPWRQEAERERVALGMGGMTDAQIADFVNYFWKALHPELFIEPLLESGADLVVRIKADRSLDAIY